MEKLATQLTESLTQQLIKNIKEQVTQELTQRYNPAEPVDVIYARGRINTKGRCDVEDFEDDDTESSSCSGHWKSVSRRFNHPHCVHAEGFL